MQRTPHRKSETLIWKVARELATQTLPDSLLERRRARRKADLFRQAGIVFVHVPKAAGTSVASELYGGHLGHFSVRDVVAASPNDVLSLPRFTIVRNSWERAVSAYEFVRAGKGAGGLTAQVRDPRQYQTEDCATFERFIQKWLLERNIDELNPVFRSQVYYTRLRDGSVPFDHVGRVDRLRETELWVQDVLGEKVEFGRHNSVIRSPWRTYYSPKLVDIVGYIYREDIQQFGFSF